MCCLLIVMIGRCGLDGKRNTTLLKGRRGRWCEMAEAVVSEDTTTPHILRSLSKIRPKTRRVPIRLCGMGYVPMPSRIGAEGNTVPPPSSPS
ncbi:hypothetical protein Hanom_Chr06g00489981 [Helianthus anomalus]